MITDLIVPILAQNLDPQTIILYGSYAQNLQDEKSDFDLLALFKKIPSPNIRKNAYEKIPDVEILDIASATISLNNGWDNSWSPVNDKLLIHGKKVEIGYNTIDWVNRIVENLIVKHQTTCEEFPFRPYTFLGLLESCQVLYDPQKFIQEILSQIRPFPQPLKGKVIKEFLPILLEAHEELMDYSARNIGILSYQFYLFRAIDALIQILFVLNKVYDPASKRTEPLLFKLKILPPGLEEFVLKVLPRFYEKQKEVTQFLEKAIEFIHNHSQVNN